MQKLLRIEIFVGENDSFGHHPLASVIVDMARRFGVPGATLSRGIEGYGRSGELYSTRLPDSSPGLPVVVSIVDSPSHARAFLVQARGLLANCVVVTTEVDRLDTGWRP
jgi:PII-like signaling protein